MPRFEKPFTGSTGFEFTLFGRQFFRFNAELAQQRLDRANEMQRTGGDAATIRHLRRRWVTSKVS